MSAAAMAGVGAPAEAEDRLTTALGAWKILVDNGTDETLALQSTAKNFGITQKSLKVAIMETIGKVIKMASGRRPGTRLRPQAATEPTDLSRWAADREAWQEQERQQAERVLAGLQRERQAQMDDGFMFSDADAEREMIVRRLARVADSIGQEGASRAAALRLVEAEVDLADEAAAVDAMRQAQRAHLARITLRDGQRVPLSVISQALIRAGHRRPAVGHGRAQGVVIGAAPYDLGRSIQRGLAEMAGADDVDETEDNTDSTLASAQAAQVRNGGGR